MKVYPVIAALTIVNLALVLFNFTQSTSAASRTDNLVLRAQAIEIIDERGKIRASLKADLRSETVLRLMDANGTIRVKLGADESGSGLLLADETTQPGVHIIARQTGTSERPLTTNLTLRSKGGQERVIKPERP